MKVTQRVGKIPDGSQPQVGLAIAVRRLSDGVTLDTIVTDDDGFATLQRNGHLEPYFLHIGNAPGGEKFWRSDDAITASVLPLQELPHVLRAFGDGVIRGYGSELAVSLVGGTGPNLSVAPGAANVAGHPVATYSTVTLSNSRPSSGTRIDRVILRLYPTGSGTTPGKADVALLQGEVGGGAPALTTTSTVHEVSLAQVNVPAAGVITVTDERLFANEKLPVSGVVRDASASTSSAVGVAVGTILEMTLPRAATYDIHAILSALQVNSASVTAWVLQGTFGPTFNGLALSGPGQMATDSSGNVYIADTGNDRIVKLNSSGAFVATVTGIWHSPSGVAVDSAGNIYIVDRPTAGSNDARLIKKNSAFTTQWTKTDFVSTFRHVATDGTHAFVTDAVEQGVKRFLCTTGAGDGAWGGTVGSGNGQFNSPYGIAVDSTHVYVTELGNDRVQKFTKTGTFVTKWGVDGTDDGEFQNPYAIAIDSTGNVWVADDANGVQRFTNTGVFVDAPVADRDQRGLAFATGDILWEASFTLNTVAKWDEELTAGGYGQIAVNIGGVVSDYTGLGQLDGAMANAATGTATGPGTVQVGMFARATADTLSLQGLVLAASAVPRS